MSRMALKKEKRKRKRYMKSLLVMIILFLGVGLILTERSMKEMLGIYNDSWIFRHEKSEELHYIYFLGGIYHLDVSIFTERIILYFNEIKAWLSNIIS